MTSKLISLQEGISIGLHPFPLKSVLLDILEEFIQFVQFVPVPSENICLDVYSCSNSRLATIIVHYFAFLDYKTRSVFISILIDHFVEGCQF